jgi:hypothetical protein
MENLEKFWELNTPFPFPAQIRSQQTRTRRDDTVRQTGRPLANCHAHACMLDPVLLVDTCRLAATVGDLTGQWWVKWKQRGRGDETNKNNTALPSIHNILHCSICIVAPFLQLMVTRCPTSLYLFPNKSNFTTMQEQFVIWLYESERKPTASSSSTLPFHALPSGVRVVQMQWPTQSAAVW